MYSADRKGGVMRRALALALWVLVSVACDPIHKIAAKNSIPAPMDQTCIIETLRKEKTVRKAGIGETGLTYPILNIPTSLQSPEQNPDVGIDVLKNEKGALQLEFDMTWAGSAGSPEYRTYIQTVLEEL